MPKANRLLKCGHDRTELRIIRYKCNLAAFHPGCTEMHSTSRCQKCLDEGTTQLPDDFWTEVSRRKVYRTERVQVKEATTDG